MAKSLIRDAPDLLVKMSNFTTGTLSGQRYYRLSRDPQLGELPPVWAEELLRARRLNETHYMPYCTECDSLVSFDVSVGQFAHEVESVADHIAVMAQHEDSYIDPPEGLAYVVSSYGTPIAWRLHNGETVIPELTYDARTTKHQQLVRAAWQGPSHPDTFHAVEATESSQP